MPEYLKYILIKCRSSQAYSEGKFKQLQNNNSRREQMKEILGIGEFKIIKKDILNWAIEQSYENKQGDDLESIRMVSYSRKSYAQIL